jgi:hypothetical protein
MMPAPRPPVFDPKPDKPRPAKRNLRLEFDPADYDAMSREAAARGLSLKAFGRLAVKFAMVNLKSL